MPCREACALDRKLLAMATAFHRRLFAAVVDLELGEAPDVDVENHYRENGGGMFQRTDQHRVRRSVT